jgi:hypothetical protein
MREPANRAREPDPTRGSGRCGFIPGNLGMRRVSRRTPVISRSPKQAELCLKPTTQCPLTVFPWPAALIPVTFRRHGDPAESKTRVTRNVTDGL